MHIGDLMLKKGFSLIESLMGLFLLSLIAVSCLPLITSLLDNMRLNSEKDEMVFVLESSMEKIINYNVEYPNEEYILDTPVSEIIDMLMKNNDITVKLPLKANDTCKYSLTISKHNIDGSDRLWKICMEIVHKGEKRLNNVTLQAIIPVK